MYTYANTPCTRPSIYTRAVCACSVARLSKYSPTPVHTRIWDVFAGYRDFRYSDKVGKIFRHAAADTASDKSDEGGAESRMRESIFYIRPIYPPCISRLARVCLRFFLFFFVLLLFLSSSPPPPHSFSRSTPYIIRATSSKRLLLFSVRAPHWQTVARLVVLARRENQKSTKRQTQVKYLAACPRRPFHIPQPFKFEKADNLIILSVTLKHHRATFILLDCHSAIRHSHILSAVRRICGMESDL